MFEFNNGQRQRFSQELSDSIAAAMAQVAEIVRAASITMEEGIMGMTSTFDTYTEWVRKNYPAAVDANGQLRDNFLQIIADADKGKFAERAYIESLNTQPRHVCDELSDNAGYADLIPPHNGSNGPVKTVRGSFIVHPSAKWTLSLDQESIEVEFCPFCGDWLKVDPGVTDVIAENFRGVVDNNKEALYDLPQKRAVEIEFVDAATLEVIDRWFVEVVPGAGDSIMFPGETHEARGMDGEWVVQRRYWNQEGGVYHVKMLMARRFCFIPGKVRGNRQQGGRHYVHYVTQQDQPGFPFFARWR